MLRVKEAGDQVALLVAGERQLDGSIPEGKIKSAKRDNSRSGAPSRRSRRMITPSHGARSLSCVYAVTWMLELRSQRRNR
jgi:hypothetical protein